MTWNRIKPLWGQVWPLKVWWFQKWKSSLERIPRAPVVSRAIQERVKRDRGEMPNAIQESSKLLSFQVKSNPEESKERSRSSKRTRRVANCNKQASFINLNHKSFYFFHINLYKFFLFRCVVGLRRQAVDCQRLLSGRRRGRSVLDQIVLEVVSNDRPLSTLWLQFRSIP